MLEEILFSCPERFFPEAKLVRYARQLHLGPRKGGSRIDVAFSDGHTGQLRLFEIKALGGATAAVVDQVERYMRDVRTLEPGSCECPFPAIPKAGVVAPSIPDGVKALCEYKGIEYFEFPEALFEKTAAEAGIPLSMEGVPNLRLEFWSALQAKVLKTTSPLNFNPSDANNVTALRINGLDLTMRCSTDHNCLDVDLTFGTRTAFLFPAFCSRRVEIDRDLGQTVLWFKQGSERHIRAQHWANVRARDNWGEFHTWMREKADVLAHHARAIVRGY